MSPTSWPDKRLIVNSLIQQIRDELQHMTRLARDSAAAVTHEENRAEGDKDMRSTEASYLARGQAGRVQELERMVGVLSAIELKAFTSATPIESGALVRLSRGRRQALYFLLPAGGGRQVSVEGSSVSIVTPASPLGSALLGLVVGDEAEISSPSDEIVYAIEDVR